MRRLLCSAVALLLMGATARAQDPSVAGRCASPDTIAFRGAVRATDATLRGDAGLVPGPVNYRSLDRAIRSLYATGQFDDVKAECEPSADGKRATLVFTVKERPVLRAVDVTGPDRVSRSNVQDRVDLLIGRPLDPALVAKAMTRIDSLYQSEGYYLVSVKPETTFVDTEVNLMFRVDEGKRLAVSGVDVVGNKGLSDKEIVAAMETKPEGFFWFKRGELDADKFAGDVGERIPALYASKGYLDVQVLKDTIRVDRGRGKAQVDLTVSEGPRYRIGTFEVTGSRRFSNEELQRFYPFGVQPKTITGAVKGVLRVGRGDADEGYFDQARWDDATRRVGEAYSNEGYIYANVRPVAERKLVGSDSIPTVNLRWEVTEGSPAIVNRVDILGNDVTSESCIRNQILVVPGDVFRRDALIRSYQSIGNLGFFETPIPTPETHQNDVGDLDVIFRVKEKRTGNVNFGASVGQGAGVGGFLGFDQPNLFGLCKKGSINAQYGQYIKDFSLTYSDPFIRESQISGTLTLYHSQQRFYVSDVGRQTRVGGQAQIGFPLYGSRYHRVFLSYGAEKAQYGDEGLVSTIDCRIVSCNRSTFGVSYEHDTRIGLPFATDGGKQTLSAQSNGVLFGGAKYTRYTGEMRHYASLMQFGGGGLGSEPIVLSLGLSVRGGAVFGDPGGFYISQKFSLGGVQYGEQLRGYDEFSVTPSGYVETSGSTTAQPQSFGSAFYTSSVELGLRINQQLAFDAFYDAGNIWARPRDFNPTRLLRGAGFGASIVTPLGPLGLDLGYGFDRTTNGVKDPKWTVHFKLGQLF
ncbi:MAG: outer membrane protein assembly factor BamA [Gemmatimonadota bacterium]